MRLIDIFVAENKLFAWIQKKGTSSFIECDFEPEIFVYGSVKKLLTLQKVLSRYMVCSELRNEKTLKGIKTVLRVSSDLKGLRKLILDIDKFGNYSFEIFNSDIPIPEYFMFKNSIFPTAKIKVRLKDSRIAGISACEGPYDTYRIPALKKAFLSVTTSASLNNAVPPELVSINFNEKKYAKDEIKLFVYDFRKEDPDIILTENGTLELPFLLNIIRQQFPEFSFSRFGKDIFGGKGRVYYSYGRVIYRNAGVYLKGRLHIERQGTIYGRWNLWHTFEIARICRTTIQRINHRSSGYGVTNLQMYYAMKKGFLIPFRMSFAEVWKSGTELFNADRGALIYEPQIGFHTDTAEIDFISLYPNIMVKENISPETLFCSCCRNFAPGLNITICTKEKGIVPEMLAPIIAQRLHYKKRTEKEYSDRGDALKGLLVTSFGYMGFRKSKLARIEGHQAIQAYARELLLASTKIAEEHGFEVVHGIVDSLWIKKKGISSREVLDLIAEIYERTGYESKLEGMYRWIMFLPSTTAKEVPVPTRFYGVFDTGEIKCRGIELRKHDTPRIIASLQSEIIDSLAEAKNYDEFIQKMRQSMMALKDTIDKIISGKAKKEDLVIRKGISRTEYSSRSAEAIIVEQLKKKGFEPHAGQYIKYLILDKGSDIAQNRYGFAGNYDSREYARLARRAIQNLFSPFVDVSIMEKQRMLYDYDNQGIEIKGLPLQVKARAG